jgi:SAM-dependent methyltransferase
MSKSGQSAAHKLACGAAVCRVRMVLAHLAGMLRVLALLIGSAVTTASAQVPYIQTPDPIVMEMLKLASVGENDVVYDLGSGDGRIVVAAAKHFGARGVGIDIDPERVADGIAKARTHGVDGRVKFIQGDLFAADVGEATVVTLYLVPRINLKLRPKLLRELKPGTRIVSHNFDMGDWKPERTVRVGRSKLYYWVVPRPASGSMRP